MDKIFDNGTNKPRSKKQQMPMNKLILTPNENEYIFL